MSTNTRIALAELVLYALALWASYEMSKTDAQRAQDRLRAYLWTWRLARVGAYGLGRLALRAELAYYREVNP